MINKNFTIKLDIKNDVKNIIPTFSLSDNNTSDISIKLVSDNKSLNIENTIPFLIVVSPNKYYCADFLEIIPSEYGLLNCNLPQIMKNEVGEWQAKLMLVQGDKRITTQTFSYHINYDDFISFNNVVESDDRYPVLTELISRLSTIELHEQERETTFNTLLENIKVDINNFKLKTVKDIKDTIDNYLINYSDTITSLKNDFNEAVSNVTNGNESVTNTEIVLARKGEKSLKDKMDKIDEQFNTIKSNKLDKNGILSMANMGQDIKEAMTGGSVAVVEGESVGLNNFTKQMKENYSRTIDDVSSWSTGRYDSNGVFQENSYMYYKIINCVSGDRFIISSAIFGNTFYGAMALNSNNTVLGKYLQGGNSEFSNNINVEIVMPLGTTKLIVQSAKNAPTDIKSVSKYEILSVKNSVEITNVVKNELAFKDLNLTWENKEVRFDNGVLVIIDHQYRRLARLSCYEGEKYKITANNGVSNSTGIEYFPIVTLDSSGNVVRKIKGSSPNPTIDYELTIQNGETQILIINTNINYNDCKASKLSVNFDVSDIKNDLEKLKNPYSNLDTFNDLKLTISPTLYALEGQEFNLYFDNIIAGDYRDYYWDINIYQNTTYKDLGMQLENRYTLTPVLANVGEYRFLLTQRDKNFKIINDIECKLKVLPVNKTGNLKLLPCGDSTTAFDNSWVKQMIDNYTSDSLRVTTIGKYGVSPYKKQAVSGWTLKNLYDDMCTDGVFNFSSYMSSISESSVDVVSIHIGINDTSWMTPDKVDAQWETNKIMYDTMISSIKNFNSNIKIAIDVTIPVASSQDGFGYKRLSALTKWTAKRAIHRYSQHLIEYFKNRETEGIYLVPFNVNLDTVNNYPMAEKQINARNTDKIKVIIDEFHPATSGFAQMADSKFAFLKSLV